MTISAGQPVTAAVVNAALMSRTDDTSTTGKVSLENVDSATINDIQNATNEVFDAVGMTGEGDATRKDYSSNNFVSNGDSHKVAIGKIDTALKAHQDDVADAHAASAITNTPSGNLSAITVQAALNELQSDVDSANTGLSNHLGDTTDAHDASAISNVPSGNLAATDVQAALNELQSDIDTRATSTDLTNHMSDTSTHGITSDIVGRTETQDLSNKSFTDAITGTEIATPSAPASGKRKIYAKTDGWYDQDSGGIETKIGTGSGGGGGLDTLATYSSDSDNSTWTTFNNASWGTFTGSLLGTFTKQNSSSPLRGTYSYTLQANAGVSLNDGVVSEVVSIPIEFRGRYISVSTQYTYNGADNEYALKIWDNTNSAELSNSDIAYVKTASGVTTLVKAVFIPLTCTEIRFGFHAVAEPSANALLKFDSIEISRDPFVYKNLVSQDVVYGSGNNGAVITATITDINWTEVTDTGGNWNGSVFTATRSGILRISGTIEATSATPQPRAMLYKNGTFVRLLGPIMASGSSTTHGFSGEIPLQTWEYISIRASAGITLSNASSHNISLSFLSETEHVVTPATSPKEVDLTVTGTNWTTTSARGVYYQTGDGSHRLKFNIVGSYTSAVRTSALVNISGVTFSPIGSQAVVGYADAAGAYNIEATTLANTSSITIAHASSTTVAYGFSGDVKLASIPTWATPTSSQYLAAVPVEQVAIVKGTGTSGANYGQTLATGTASAFGAYATAALIAITGDSGFVSLAANRITLVAGKYDLSAIVPIGYGTGANDVDADVHIRIRDITNSSNLGSVLDGHAQGTAAGVGGMKLVPVYSPVLNITSPIDIEIQVARTGSTGSVAIGGYPQSTAATTIDLTQVKIRKLK